MKDRANSGKDAHVDYGLLAGIQGSVWVLQLSWERSHVAFLAQHDRSRQACFQSLRDAADGSRQVKLGWLTCFFAIVTYVLKRFAMEIRIETVDFYIWNV